MKLESIKNNTPLSDEAANEKYMKLANESRNAVADYISDKIDNAINELHAGLINNHEYCVAMSELTDAVRGIESDVAHDMFFWVGGDSMEDLYKACVNIGVGC